MIAALIPVIGTVIDKIFPDREEAAKAKLRMLELEQQGAFQDIQIRGDIIKEEAKSEHFITAAWRPITMLVFVFIVANNYILAPYVDLFFDTNIYLELPSQLWDLLQIGLGGYVVGRSAEKMMKEYKEK